MDFLRNKEVRLQIMLCIGVTVIGSVLSYFFCMKFYWVTFLTGCAITAISLIFTYRRYMKISSLSQDIDRLLHGEESIRFDDYGEGELAVLEKHEPKLYAAATSIFKDSYEYTRKYRAFQKQMNGRV